MPSHRILVAVCAAAAAIGASSTARAQTSREIITSQLENADRLAEMQGFRLDGRALSPSALVGLLEADGQFIVEVELEASAEYLIEGFCDEDCTDIDLSLNAPDGESVVSDVETDDVPELRFRASENGRYFLGVHLVDCSTSRCYYAVRVLRK